MKSKLSKEDFTQLLKEIKSATSSEQNKIYTNISVKPCIVGERESGTQFIFDIDVLYDIYQHENLKTITPSDLKVYIRDLSRSAAAAILHEVEKHIK